MALDKEKLERLGLNAQLVYDETKMSANTHTRVGQAFLDAHDLFEEVGDDESDIAQLQKDVEGVQKDIDALKEQEENDIKAVNDSIDALKEQEEKDIAEVNEKIDAITPRLILPLAEIVTEEVTIQTTGSAQSGRAVWCSANKAFAWEVLTVVATYYGSWAAYGVYPDANVYGAELTEGLNRDVWYYVASEGAFYYWNGEEMEKITDTSSLNKSDLTGADVADDCDYLIGVKDGQLVRVPSLNVFAVKEEG